MHFRTSLRSNSIHKVPGRSRYLRRYLLDCSVYSLYTLVVQINYRVNIVAIIIDVYFVYYIIIVPDFPESPSSCLSNGCDLRVPSLFSIT